MKKMKTKYGAGGAEQDDNYGEKDVDGTSAKKKKKKECEEIISENYCSSFVVLKYTALAHCSRQNGMTQETPPLCALSFLNKLLQDCTLRAWERIIYLKAPITHELVQLRLAPLFTFVGPTSGDDMDR